MFYFFHASSKRLVFLKTLPQKNQFDSFQEPLHLHPFILKTAIFALLPLQPFYPMAQQRQQTDQDVTGKGKASMADVNEDPTSKMTNVSPKTSSESLVAEDEVEDIWEREAKKLRMASANTADTWRPWPDQDSMLSLCSFIVSSIEHGISDVKFNASAVTEEDDYDDAPIAAEQEVQDVDPNGAMQDAAEDDNDVTNKVDADREVADKVDAENNADTEDNVADDDADAKDPSSSSSKPNP